MAGILIKRMQLPVTEGLSKNSALLPSTADLFNACRMHNWKWIYNFYISFFVLNHASLFQSRIIYLFKTKNLNHENKNARTLYPSVDRCGNQREWPVHQEEITP